MVCSYLLHLVWHHCHFQTAQKNSAFSIHSLKNRMTSHRCNKYEQIMLSYLLSVKPGFHLDLFTFCCSFWFFVPTKSHNKQWDAQMETSTKNENEQQKAITSNKRHLPILGFEIELILSQKQERATKSNRRQRTANGNTHQKPKQATKTIFHSYFHSFAPILDLWEVIDIKSNEKPERATTDGQRKAAKSYEEHQKATTDIGAGKTKTGKKKPRRATKGKKYPNGNQALTKLGFLYHHFQSPFAVCKWETF